MMRGRTLAAAGAALAFIAGGGIAYAATSYTPPCTSQTNGCLDKRLDKVEAWIQSQEPVATPAPTSTTVTPAPTTTTPAPEPTTATPTVEPTTVTPSPSTTTASSTTDVPPGFPNEANTGHTGTLTVTTGDLTITTPGTIIENREIRGQVNIQAANVTLRNVNIVSTGYWGILCRAGGLLVEDSTLQVTADAQASIGGSGYTLRRVDMFGGGDGAKTDGARSPNVIEDSFVHALSNDPSAHNDGLEITNSPNTTIRHNTVLNHRGQTSAIMLSEYGSNPDTNVLVEGNFFGGGGFTLYGGAPDTAKGHEVRDNLFTTRFFPESGYYGAAAYWSATGNTWSGNRWYDGPNAGQTFNP